jgi:molybdate transport system substrate-binding protein
MIRAIALVACVLTPAAVDAAEITVLCSRAVQHVVAAAAEAFQKNTRHSVWLSYGETGAIAGRALTESADVVIANVPAVTELEAKAALRPGTRVVLGSVGLGVAVRAGTPVPDIASTTKLRRAILQATSLAYPDPERGAPTGHHVSHVLDLLGIAPLVDFKTTLFPDGPRALASVARGQIELAVAPISEILTVEGVALAGPLPRDYQITVVYAAGVMTKSAAPDVAGAFLTYLASPEVRTQLTAAGVEPGN